ncbi:glycoprotein IX (platelet) [Lampris incognitus]|uniref:glycoprotein IX (platelet) n=1 Tax=Lampris incognitus TaxID=2546036 RepID=UPI0024B5A602|nr:glycoprotein IX (platelet) [Lampris incognitus]
MLFGSGLAVFLLLATSNARTVAQPCLCSALPPAGLRVNCSSLNLMEVPHLPPDTTELHLQDNQLTTVSPGSFDRLLGLRRVSLSGNPFHCDCRIQYLRNWLLKNRAVISMDPICASPDSVARTAVTQLSDEHFHACAERTCAGGAYNILLGGMLCCLIVLLMWGLRLAKRASFTLDIDERHTRFGANSLYSLRPKHRRRLRGTPSEFSGSSASLNWTEDLETALINMELLPQILDVLHKKHNIKIKAN